MYHYRQYSQTPYLVLHPCSMLNPLPQLPLPRHLPRNIDRMLHRLPRHPPQLLPHLLRLFTPLLKIRIEPFEIECQVQVLLIFSLRDRVVDEGPRVYVVEIHLRIGISIAVCYLHLSSLGMEL